MKVYFVNSAFVTIPKTLILCGGGRGKLRLRVRYGIIVHPDLGPIIIDGGYGPNLYNVVHPSLALKAYRSLLKPEILPEGAPDIALAKLGFQVHDVQHIILTHCHADHVGYLGQFPDATIHSAEKIISTKPHQNNGVFPELLPPDLVKRSKTFDSNAKIPLPHDLGQGMDIFGDQSVLSVALSGHMNGHFGLYFPTLSHPFLYAVDTAWTHEGLLENRERQGVLKMVSASYPDCVQSANRVRKFSEAGGLVILCHDPVQTEYDLGDAPA